MTTQNGARNRRKVPRGLVTATAVLALLALGRPSAAYWDEVHYHLTYYLGRLVGFTPEQAYRIAAADASLDHAAATEPGQGHRATKEAQAPRWRFHALRDLLAKPAVRILEGDADDAADAAVVQQRHALHTLSLEEGNPGIFLHFFQDELPHLSYGSVHGHWVEDEAQLRRLREAGLTVGGAVDWLSFHPEEYNVVLARDCAEFLLDAMKRLVPEQAKVRGRMPSDADLLAIVTALRAANAAPPQLTDEQLVPYGLYYLQPTMLAPKDPELLRIFEKHRTGPDEAKAHEAVAAAMRGKGMSEFGPKGGGLREAAVARRAFDFGADGRLPSSGDRERYVLAGDLEVTLAEDLGQQGKTFDVLVKAPSTMAGEEEAELKRATGLRPGGKASFETLPVGVLVLEAVQDGVVIARNSRAKVLARKNRATLGLPRWVLAKDARTVTWTESTLGWSLEAGAPTFSPEAGAVVRSEDLMGEATCSRPMPGLARFRRFRQANPVGHGLRIDTEMSGEGATVKVEHLRGKESSECTLSFAWTGGLPDEVNPGDEFPLHVAATAQVTGTLDGDTPADATLGIAGDFTFRPPTASLRISGRDAQGRSTAGDLRLTVLAPPPTKPTAILVFRLLDGAGQLLTLTHVYRLEEAD